MTSVAVFLPSGDLAGQRFLVGDTAIETLGCEDRELGFPCYALIDNRLWRALLTFRSALAMGSKRQISTTSSSFAPGAASRPIVRGLDNYRVRIQENGVGASGVSEMGEDHAVPLDPLGASQMEVVRGPATLRWGSQAIGCVVNVANNRIPEKPPCAPDAAFHENGCARAETRAAIATVDNLLENATLLDAGRGNFLVHADAHGRRASDYRIPGYPYLYIDPFAEEPPPYFAGRQPNSSNRSGGASLGASYLIPTGGFVGFAVTQYNSRYRIPGVEPTATETASRCVRLASPGRASSTSARPMSTPSASGRD